MLGGSRVPDVMSEVRFLILCIFVYKDRLCMDYLCCSPKQGHLNLKKMLEQSTKENTLAMHQKPHQKLFTGLIRPRPPIHRTLAILNHRRQQARYHPSHAIAKHQH